MKRGKVIFIAVLDWGLGHATRCVPIIDYLLQEGHQLHIGGNGDSLLWLKSQYPKIPFYELPDYNIQYHKYGSQAWALLWQQNKIMRAIRNEHQVMQQLVGNIKPDLIISDNRYGCYSAGIPSVLLTHQLHLPGVPVFFQSLIDAFLYQLIKDFDEIWIPDEAQGICLSGKLSHPALKKIKCRYIGLLSRFEKYIPMEKEYDVLVILSGPEPHRSILEEKIFMQLNARSDWKCAMVIGSSKALQLEPARHITIFPLADGQTLKKLIEVSELIVCRSGYSSLMDLQHSNKKLLLIPTPGQAEQQYLAAHFSKYHQVVVQKQSNIDIQQGILQSKNDSMMKIPVNTRFKQVVQEWLNT